MICDEDGLGFIGDCVGFDEVFLLNEVVFWEFVGMFILYDV